MDNVDIIYLLLILSTFVMLYFLLLVQKRKHKKQIHYAVLGITLSVLLWNAAGIIIYDPLAMCR